MVGWAISEVSPLTPYACSVRFDSSSGSSMTFQAPPGAGAPDAGTPWYTSLQSGTSQQLTETYDSGSSTMRLGVTVSADTVVVTLHADAQMPADAGDVTAMAGLQGLKLCYLMPGASTVDFEFTCTSHTQVAGQSSGTFAVPESAAASYCAGGSSSSAAGVTNLPQVNAGSQTVRADPSGLACLLQLDLSVQVGAGALQPGEGGTSSLDATVTIHANAQ